jgi:hypothetical protein
MRGCRGDFQPMSHSTTATARTADVAGAVAFPPWLPRAVVACFLAASFTSTWGGVYLFKLQSADIFLVLTVGAVLTMVIFGKLRFAIPRWLWAPAVALFACVAAQMYHPIPDSTFALRFEYSTAIGADSGVKSAFWIIALLAVPISAIACTALDARMPRWIVACYLAGVAVCSLVALTDLLGVTSISRYLGYQYDAQRQTGLSDHPNSVGVFCAIAAPFAVYFISGSRHRWLPCTALVLLCGGIVASGSRGAQAIFPAAILISVLISPHKKKVTGWLAGTLTVAVVGGLVALTQSKPHVLDKLFRFDGGEKGSSANSNAERAMLHTQALDDLKTYPIFGIGIKHINEAHNIYLQMMSAGGCVLLAGMLIYWFGALHSSWLNARSGERLAPHLMVSVTVWLVIGVLENQLTDRYLYYTIGVVAAIAATWRTETLPHHLLARTRRPGNAIVAVEHAR